MINKYKFFNKKDDTFEDDEVSKVDNMLIGVSFIAGAVCGGIVTIIIQLIVETFFTR